MTDFEKWWDSIGRDVFTRNCELADRSPDLYEKIAAQMAAKQAWDAARFDKPSRSKRARTP